MQHMMLQKEDCDKCDNETQAVELVTTDHRLSLPVLQTNESKTDDAGDSQIGWPVTVSDAPKDTTLFHQHVSAFVAVIMAHELL